MSESSGNIKMKRNRIRPFRNPPQPHMCIRNYFQGTTKTCYVNVLSWNEVALSCPFSDQFLFSGGFTISPPHEKQNVTVFVVIVHPDVLETNGKYAVDTHKKLAFVERVLEFLETTQEAVALSRMYTIMEDCDIMGELKNIWIAVQDIQDKEEKTLDEIAGEKTKQQQTQDEQPPSYPTKLSTLGCDDFHEHENAPSKITDIKHFPAYKDQDPSPNSTWCHENCDDHSKSTNDSNEFGVPRAQTEKKKLENHQNGNSQSEDEDLEHGPFCDDENEADKVENFKENESSQESPDEKGSEIFRCVIAPQSQDERPNIFSRSKRRVRIEPSR